MRHVAALLAPAVLAACVAAAPAPGLSEAERFEIRQHLPGADLDGLTAEQVAALRDVLHHGDGFDAGYRIESILAR